MTDRAYTKVRKVDRNIFPVLKIRSIKCKKIQWVLRTLASLSSSLCVFLQKSLRVSLAEKPERLQLVHARSLGFHRMEKRSSLTSGSMFFFFHLYVFVDAAGSASSSTTTIEGGAIAIATNATATGRRTES